MNWLLLRGLSREQRHWGRALEFFRAAFPDGHAQGIDLPGTGTEHRRASPASMRGIAADVRERWLAARAARPGPWSLLGISLGGMVAMQWVADHPEDFARLVLVNTSAADLSAPWRRLHPSVAPQLLRALVERDPLARQRRILGFTARLVPDPDAVAREWALLQQQAPVARLTVVRQLWASARFRAPPRLAIPALVLAGARDPLCDPRCPGRLAARFGAPLEVHPQAGHDLALDAPEWLAERVRTWCGASPRGAAAAVS